LQVSRSLGLAGTVVAGFQSYRIYVHGLWQRLLTAGLSRTVDERCDTVVVQDNGESGRDVEDEQHN